MKRISLILSATILCVYTFAQDSATKKIDGLISAYSDVGRFNGSVLIARHGRILLQKGYGLKNAQEKTANDANTVFQVASVTKQFTAAVILKLVEQKKMTLADKLSKYYSGFPNGDSISVENLLNHTSGLHNFTEEDTSIIETYEQRMVAYLKTLKPDFAPGSKWHYSNSGYVMLGYIIQKVSGMSYWRAVRKYIFNPLQMNNSGFDFAHFPGSGKAVGYDQLNDSLKQRSEITDSTVPFAAGSIYSTAGDMYKWHNGLQSYKVVGKTLMDKAYTPCSLNNYGYGWQIDSVFGKRMVSHSGSISGFGSNFARIPEDDVCIVLLSNKANSTFDLVNMTNKLLAILYDQPYSIPVKRVAVKLDSETLKRYTGTYEIEELQLTIDVFINDGLLIAQPYRDSMPGPTSVMLAIDNKRFYGRNDEEIEIAFETDSSGKTIGVNIIQQGIKRYAKKTK